MTPRVTLQQSLRPTPKRPEVKIEAQSRRERKCFYDSFAPRRHMKRNLWIVFCAALRRFAGMGAIAITSMIDKFGAAQTAKLETLHTSCSFWQTMHMNKLIQRSAETFPDLQTSYSLRDGNVVSGARTSSLPASSLLAAAASRSTASCAVKDQFEDYH